MDTTHTLSTQFMGFSAISCAYRLRLPVLLQDAPQSARALGQATGARVEKVERLLLFLESLGLFNCDPTTGLWGNTELGLSFIGCSPHPSFILSGASSSLRAYSKFYDSLSSEETCFELAHGMSFFEYLQQESVENEEFNETMKVYTEHALPDILQSIDFTGSQRLLDVGGGIGTLLCAVLEKQPFLTGGLMELQQAHEQAREFISHRGMAEKVSLVSGDFFEEVPWGYDAIMLKSILHDWDDAKCVKLLKNCQAALKVGDKLVIIDIVLDRGSPLYAAQRIADVGMMCTAGGKERTSEEFRELLELGGFLLVKVERAGLVSILYSEAVN